MEVHHLVKKIEVVQEEFILRLFEFPQAQSNQLILIKSLDVFKYLTLLSSDLLWRFGQSPLILFGSGGDSLSSFEFLVCAFAPLNLLPIILGLTVIINIILFVRLTFTASELI